MVASTLPVQWLMPLAGWRPLFWALALAVLLSMAVIAWQVPRWPAAPPCRPAAARPPGRLRRRLAQPVLPRMTPIGFFSYGGMIAMQTLWAGPWMVKVAGYARWRRPRAVLDQRVHAVHLLELGAGEPAAGAPWLHHRTADRLGPAAELRGADAIIALGPRCRGRRLGLVCMASTFVSLAQPAVGMAFPPRWPGGRCRPTTW
jgi:hypothetical protein